MDGVVCIENLLGYAAQSPPVGIVDGVALERLYLRPEADDVGRGSHNDQDQVVNRVWDTVRSDLH